MPRSGVARAALLLLHRVRTRGERRREIRLDVASLAPDDDHHLAAPASSAARTA